MRRVDGPLPERLVEETLARFRREAIARGWVQEDKADQVVEVVREQVEETYGIDRRSQDT
ncbi:MAG: hypothetical protein F4038_08975 [Chloroflexi bacterium]|nr:hypothetical protein [Chloroflexota bacterium]MYA01588.1 hypothetical protein [Chloroflexota bacterium]MYC01837.1 hypothetical protein [Chloroflexota bacterium]MYJ93162.1 hypothetical protein [Chloroflexota bacterium]